jgi:hypothetical protein
MAVADAATGGLANVYGYECLFDDIVELIATAEDVSTQPIRRSRPRHRSAVHGAATR